MKSRRPSPILMQNLSFLSVMWKTALFCSGKKNNKYKDKSITSSKQYYCILNSCFSSNLNSEDSICLQKDFEYSSKLLAAMLAYIIMQNAFFTGLRNKGVAAMLVFQHKESTTMLEL